jgi:D-alanyl-D-alanine carboxypeptidase
MKKYYTNNNIRPRASACFFPCITALLLIFMSCSVTRQINKQVKKIILPDTVISTGHTGISIYEPATGSYWYNYDATTYFVPASNTKLFSLYAGLKYLGDSLTAAKYSVVDNNLLNRLATPLFCTRILTGSHWQI